MKLVLVFEPRGALGDALEQVADESRPGKHVGEPLGSARRITQHTKEPVGLAKVIAQPAESEQAVIGVGALREPAEHDGKQGALDGRAARYSPGKRCDVVESPRRIPEADGSQPRLGLLARQGEPVAGKRSHS